MGRLSLYSRPLTAVIAVGCGMVLGYLALRPDLLVLAIAVVIALVAVQCEPQWIMYGWIVLRCLSEMAPPVAGIDGSSWLGGLLLLVFIARHRRQAPIPLKHVWPLGALVAVGLLTLLISPTVGGFTEALKWCSYGVLFIFAVESKVSVTALFRCLLIASVIPAGYAAWQHFSGHEEVILVATQGGYQPLGRVQGTFAQPNELANVMCFVALGVIVFWRAHPLWANGIALVLSLVILSWTEARGQTYALVALVSLAIWLHFRKWWLSVGVTMIALTVVLLAIGHAGLARYAAPIAHFGNSAVSDRFVIWATQWKLFLTSPVVGNGLNTAYVNVLGALSPVSAQNVYLMLLVEAGIPGLVLFLGQMGVILREGIRQVRQRLPSGSLLLLYTLFFLIIGMEEDILNEGITAGILFLVFGAVVGGSRLSGQIL